MSAPGSFNLLAVDDLRTSPSLGSTQHDHRPPGKRGTLGLAGVPLNFLDLRKHGLECGSHELMHRLRLLSFGEVGLVAVSRVQVSKLLIAQTAQDSRIRDLVAIQMENRYYRSVAGGI